MTELLNGLHTMMLEIGADYAVCGGHAIDLFLERKTRPHKDLDVAVFWEDRDQIVRYMLQSGWLVFEPYGGRYLHRIRSVSGQKRIKSNIWCVSPANGHYRFRWRGRNHYAVRQDDVEQSQLDFVEFLFNKREEGCFLYARDPAVRLGLGKAIRQAGKLPYLAPELVLLYKSTSLQNPDYALDFTNTLPQLGAEEQSWLQNALTAQLGETHEWAAALRRTPDNRSG